MTAQSRQAENAGFSTDSRRETESKRGEEQMRHTQQPRQSRSPTGGVDKPSISSTPSRKGRVKGPQHSYGRGLPVKRKALIILSIAILAFAMIPALGAGAASGVVKIVTPDQLATPSGKSGSAFDKLTPVQYVSTALDNSDTNLEGTSSTLHVVIDDDDEKANTLTDYSTYYDTDDGTFDARTFYIRPSNATTLAPSRIARANNSLLDANHLTHESDNGGNADDDDDEGEALIIGNRNREGVVDAADVIIQAGYYTVATPVADASKKSTEKWDTITFVPQITYTPSLFTAPVLHTDGSIIALQLDNGQINPPDVPQGVTGATRALRITFASATENNLNYTTGSNKGKSRVEVVSASGDRIRVTANETDIAGLATEQKDGVNGEELAAATSKDSGTFVGIIGVLDYDNKRMLETWVTDDQGGDRVVPADSTATFEVVTSVTADPQPTPTPRAGNILVADSDTDLAAVNNQVSVDLVLPEPANGYQITGTPEVTGTFPARAADDAIQNAAVRAVSGVAITGSQWFPEATTGEGAAAARTLRVTVSDVIETPSNVVVAAAAILQHTDTFTVTYKTTASVSTLTDALGEPIATRHDAFDNLVDRDNKDHAAALATLLEEHADRLGIDDTDAASTLVNSLIGVRHGDTISVQYADESGGTSTTNTRVDSVKPSIGGLNPANGSFTTDPTFDMLFEVTDADSGIKEDADTKNVGGRSIKDLAATASAMYASGTSTGTTYALVPDEEDDVSDGYLYEMRIDAGADSLEAEKLTPPQNLKLTITIKAYDIARNSHSLDVTYEIDTIDPDLTGAITGWAVKSSDTAKQKDGKVGAHILAENQKNSMVLIFNGPIDGSTIRPNDIAVGGAAVASVMWLDNKGANVISVGTLTAGAGDATDMDFNEKTATSSNARDDVGDSNTGQPAGMGLRANGNGQDARHLLFVTFEGDVATDARPAVGLDNDDVMDLAGNTNRSDHSVARATDRVSPRFTVTVDPKLSNSALSATIDASEGLDRPPTVKVGERTVSARPASGGGWTLSEDLASLGFSKATATQDRNDGVHVISVTGVDEDDNEGSSMSAKWELDTRANKSALPTRGGGNADEDVTQKIETNDVVFLNVSFDAEADEYTGDTKKKISISSLSLETLSADSINSSTDKIVDSPTVDSTTDLDASTAQSRDGIKHVVALSDLALGNYRLQIGYADEAGNTGTFGYVFTITAPAPEKVEVVPGWSLISIPGTPQDKSIAGVLEGSSVTDVWSLNNETKVWEFARMDEEGEWTGTLSQMTDGRGYFVRSTTFDPISVLTERFSPQRTPPQYTVSTGWNSIGYTPAGEETMVEVDAYLSSLGTTGWGMIRAWNADATPPQYETYFSSGTATDGFEALKNGTSGPAVVKAGQGYLLFATRNGVIGG